ncbi:hypothetical protein ccbrp13_60720 [Ktedonobacteria bacterium brp13]|nr:hypothetical protein ccbrp13_60720 [Ktedonobacteria bacterium brp13]
MNATFPFTLCCQLLGVDPKTLRHWLAEASIEPTNPPTDSRLKLLTLEQIYQLAVLYRRPITPPADPSGEAQREATLLQGGELSPPRSEEAAMLQQKLTQLEGRLATVCDHLTHLALLLVQQQQRQIALVEPLLHTMEGNQPSPLDANERGTQAQEAPQAQGWQPLPAELRARTHMLPLVEYGAQGRYVIISPQEGELSLLPDSPAWFDWLASLASFRFVGQQGRLSAY